MKHLITGVDPGSLAERAGIRSGWQLLSIDGQTVNDIVDYELFTSSEALSAEFEDENGEKHTSDFKKEVWEPLGLNFTSGLMSKVRQCANHCVFCFIDQMPSGMRETLYVKDDDWRLSLMMGNYVTLTNVDDAEFIRILRRKASPLYISVHATDGDVRVRMLRNPNARNIMERLTALKNHGIRFHAQVVLCPGINDGEMLERTVKDLASLWPAALSVAVVPIGMTRFRDGLAQIPPVDREKAEEVLRSLEPYQERFLEQFGTRFVFPSDEFYCVCGRDIPEEEIYEDYPQIENGVGLIRQLQEECGAAFRDLQEAGFPPPPEQQTRTVIATGVSVRPHIEELVRKYAPPWNEVEVIAVPNRFFGESITVTGLIVGQDLVSALKGREFDRVMISASMLRENTDCFLDDMTLDEVRCRLGKAVRVVENSGEDFIRALYLMEDEHE